MGIHNSAVFDASGILTMHLAPFVADTLRKEIGEVWWKQAYENCFTRDPKLTGKNTHQDRINALDFMRCYKLVERYWDPFFRLHLSGRFRNNLKMTYEIYNRAKHEYNQLDMPESEAIQCISTMCLVLEDINKHDAALQLKRLLFFPTKKQAVISSEVREVKPKIPNKSNGFTDEVIETVNSVSAGEIATYADLSQILVGKGIKSYSQTISTIIKNNAVRIEACHRIVGKSGEIKTQGNYNNTVYSQAELLRKEGVAVIVRNGKEYADVKKRKWPDMEI